MKSKTIGTKTISEGKFLKLVDINWQDNKNKIRKWEAVERTTGADIVLVIETVYEWLDKKETEGLLVDVKIRGLISYIKNILKEVNGKYVGI